MVKKRKCRSPNLDRPPLYFEEGGGRDKKMDYAKETNEESQKVRKCHFRMVKSAAICRVMIHMRK